MRRTYRSERYLRSRAAYRGRRHVDSLRSDQRRHHPDRMRDSEVSDWLHVAKQTVRYTYTLWTIKKGGSAFVIITLENLDGF